MNKKKILSTKYEMLNNIKTQNPNISPSLGGRELEGGGKSPSP